LARKLNGIELTRYDDLFKTDAERETDHQERVQIVPAEQVFPYARQPYSVDRSSADLVRLMDSIERTGIAEPLIVRPRSEGGYEIISGHRRDYCAKVVGLDTRPVIVRNYSDEDADILVVDYNINRENLLPSEKAKAYTRKGAARNICPPTSICPATCGGSWQRCGQKRKQSRSTFPMWRHWRRYSPWT
jgi:ParB family chromosome partitioning protein